MHNKKSAKLALAQKTIDWHENSQERIMRQTRRDDSKVLAENGDKNEAAHDVVEGKTRSDDLLRLCKPVSVYLTRLPESPAKKHAEPPKKLPKKRKPVSTWANGVYYKRRSKNRKSGRDSGKNGPSQEREARDHENPSGEPETSQDTRIDFDLAETSTTGFGGNVKQSGGEKTEGMALGASLEQETSTFPAPAVKLSEDPKLKIAESVSVNTAAGRVDGFSEPEESEMAEGGERNSGLVTEKHEEILTSLAVENCNENCPVSRPGEKETSRSSPVKQASRKRKTSSLSESAMSQESLQDCKKARTVLSRSESSSSEKKIRPIHEVVVVVNRLDDSRSPLVEKWKNSLSQLDEVAQNLRETVTLSTASVNEIEKENEEFDLPEKLPGLGDPRPLDIHKNTDIVMCSSAEGSSDEDDDEIMQFLAARRRKKSLTRKIHREEKSDEELPRAKTPAAKRSKSRVKQTISRGRRRLLSCSTTDDGKSEISSLSARSGRIRSKTPSSRSTRRLSDSRSDASSCEDNISPPLTRSKSRAAISSHEDSLNSRDTFQRRSKKKIFYRISDSGSSDEADEPNEKNSDNEDRVVTDEAENVRDVFETERIKETDNSLDSAAANEVKEQSVDSNRESEEKINQEMCGLDAVDKVTEEMKENAVPSVLEATKNICEVVESEETEKNDESLDSTAIIDSNLTSNRELPFERDDDMENSLARKKLATMKDAMVVLMRLEDLEDQCSAGEFDFGETGDSDFPRDFVNGTREEHNRVFTNGADGDRSLVSGGQNQREKTASPRKKQIERNDKVSEPCTKVGSGLTLTGTENGCQETNDSDDEGQLTVDESEPPEMAVTDVERPLIIIDEPDGTRSEKIASPPGAKKPSRNSAGSGNRSKCEEQPEVDDENISSTHRCITCDKLFKDAAQLEEHKISSGTCSSGFRCASCSCMLETSIELSNHRCNCAGKSLERRNSVESKEHEEIGTAEPEKSVVTTSETRPKGKKDKPATTKNPPKKKGTRPRCRSDNLTCNVCSTNFDTKTDLSEHLYKHSPEELQEAFRAAKAKAMADSRAEQAAQRKEADSQVSSEKNVNGQVISDAITPSNNNSLAGDLSALETQIMTSNMNAIASNMFNKDSLTSKQATVCFCHRDTDLATLDKTDLQIEMVLLCKYCHVIFRRRECLEVHYRTSTICSINRTRERCPSLFCANCQLTLNSWAEMRQHLELHADQNSERTIRFVCNICRVVFVGFGVLFYNHWTSHSKDSMFVAGRYNFPKFSVQTINGTEKLPVGARSDENYLFVAEHVCTTCKEPFSTRRDLEQHQQSALCTKKLSKTPPRVGAGAARHIPQPVRPPINAKNNVSAKQNESSPKQTLNSVENHNLIKTRLFCDVCKLAFINEYWLSMHSKNMHQNHFLFVPMTLSGTPLALPFKCTKCSAFAGSVSAIEKHWRTDVLHEKSVASLLNAKNPSRLPKTTAVTSSIDKDTNVQDPLLLNASIINVNDVTSTQKSKVSEEPPIITIDDVDSNCDSAATEDTSINQSVITRNEESRVSVPSITSTESIQVSNIYEGPVLENPLTDPPTLASDANRNQRTKTRALEDPCVNVRLSETSGSNLSASLVISDSVERSEDGTGHDNNTESYRILLPNGASPGNLTMTLSRTSQRDSAKEPQMVSLTRSSAAENDEGSARTTVVNEDEGEHLIISDLPGSTVVEDIEIVQRKGSDAAPPLTGSSAAQNNQVVPTENFERSSIATPGHVTKNPRRKSTDVFIVPEIIDLHDDAEECENEASTEKVNTTVNLPETRISNGDQLHAKLSTIEFAAANSLPADKVEKSCDSGSGSETGSNSAVSKSGSPRRSKMIKAALKSSDMSFEEERWNWLRSSSANRDIPTSTGPKKQGFLRVKDLSELQAARNYTCLVCSNSFESEKLLDEHRRMPMCGGTIGGRNHQYPRGIAAALVLPDPSERPNTPEPQQPPQLDPLSNDSATILERVLASQPPYCPPGGISASTTAVPAERVRVSAHQSPMLSGGSLRIQDSNQVLPEPRTPALGYHALPPIVSTPTAQANKHQHAAAQHRVPSTNPLPTSLARNAPTMANPNETSNYLCSICRAFQTSSLEAIKDHMTKHFSFRRQQIPAVRVLAPPVEPITSSPSSVDMRLSRKQLLPKMAVVDRDTAKNPLPVRDWTIKDTPQGPVIVTPLQNAMNPDRTVLRQASLNSNNLPPNPLYNSQLVYRCRICKSAVYKSYPPLRNHAILVHGITDFDSLDQGKISQNGYLCTQCPNTSALFDTQEQFRDHVDSIHTHSCPSCQRGFSNFLTLRHHLEQCRVSTSTDRNTYGKNC